MHKSNGSQIENTHNFLEDFNAIALLALAGAHFKRFFNKARLHDRFDVQDCYTAFSYIKRWPATTGICSALQYCKRRLSKG